jgi:hypothetical protein
MEVFQGHMYLMKLKVSNSELHVRCESENTMQKEIVDLYL